MALVAQSGRADGFKYPSMSWVRIPPSAIFKDINENKATP